VSPRVAGEDRTRGRIALPAGVQRRKVSAHQEFNMIARVKRFVQDRSGASAVEYGLIAAGILVAIVAVMQGLGAKLNAALGALN